MSYYLNVVNDQPRGLWLLDGNLSDSSGRSTAATVVGSPVTNYVATITASLNKMPVFDATHKAKFPSTLYKPGYEDKPFSLEAWVYPYSDNATIMSRPSNTDGLAMINGELSFSLRFTGGTRKIDYKPDSKKALHVVGIYTEEHMVLYVNGEIFEKLTFTEAQLAENFSSVSEETFVAGELGAVGVQAVAYYEYVLTESRIKFHYKVGRDARDPDTVPSLYTGSNLDISDLRTETFLHEHIGPTMSWTLGNMDTLVVNSQGELRQQYDGEKYVAGTWTYTFDTSFTDIVHGVRLGWEGEGNFIVRTSTDADTWLVAEDNKLVSSITPGTSPAQLFVEIEFPEDDNGYVSNLEIMGLRTKTLNVPNRAVTISDVVTVREEWEPLENRLDYGVSLDTGSIAFSAPTGGFYLEDHTWEFWIYATSAPVITIPGMTAMYLNGSSFSSLPVGSWNLVHAVSNGSAPLSGLTLSGNAIVGRVAAYPIALTASQVDNIYKLYTGRPAVRVMNTGAVGISSPTVKSYSSDWSLVS